MAVFEREILVDLADGDCAFRMSAPINSGAPSPRPRITGDLFIFVDRFRPDGSRRSPHIRVILPIHLLNVASAQNEVVHTVVEAWSRNQFHGKLPEELILALANALSLFFRDVAGEMGAAPDITYITAVARVRLFEADGGEHVAEAEGDGEEMGGEDEGEPTRADEGEVEEEEAGGEEETSCAICLERMESGAAAEGQWERWWLPCCHCFHRGCLQRWLQQKAECPLCRAPVQGASAGGGGGGGGGDGHGGQQLDSILTYFFLHVA